VPLRLTDAAAVARMRAAGAEPLEPYPGASVSWRCRCMKCGRTITPRVSKVLVHGVCGYCAGKLVDPASAVQVMRSAGLEPLVPYPGNKQPWPCRCLACGAEVKPRYNNVEHGAGSCNRCSGHVVDATVVDPALAAAASPPVGRLVRVPNARPPDPPGNRGLIRLGHAVCNWGLLAPVTGCELGWRRALALARVVSAG